MNPFDFLAWQAAFLEQLRLALTYGLTFGAGAALLISAVRSD